MLKTLTKRRNGGSCNQFLRQSCHDFNRIHPDDNEQIPDFNDALSNENGCAYWNGKLSSNESAMSLTRIITNENGTCVGAVRYIVSMEQVNTAIVLVSAAVIACGLVIIALVILSGLMFIRSIVTPIRKLSEISSKIAHGDFSQAKRLSTNTMMKSATSAMQ